MVDTAVAQQVADGWAAAPVVGTLSAATVQRIVADAQATAQRAVLHSQGQQQMVHIDGTPVDSMRTSSDQRQPLSGLPATAGAEAQLAGHGAASSRLDASSHSSHSAREDASASAASLSGDISAAWAAVSSALLRRIPTRLAATFQRLQRQRAVRHLEASLGASRDPSAQVGLL